MKHSIRIISTILVLIASCQIAMSQNRITRKQLNDTIKTMPSFTVHKDIYFISGVPTNSALSSKTADAKYQISFKQLITRNTQVWDTYLFLTYSQKAFWNLYEESSPFKELNFNPSIGLGKMFYNKKDELIGIGSLALEHESNGRDSIFSRSWNNIHATYNTKIGNNSRLGIKAWLPFMYKEGNADLLDYIGLGEVTYAHSFIKDKLELEVMARKGVKWDTKGALRTRLYYSPFKKKDQYLMLEWFNGYTENLIRYKEYKSMIRVGFVIRTNEFSLLN